MRRGSLLPGLLLFAVFSLSSSSALSQEAGLHLEGLEAGDPLVVTAAGARLRDAPSLRSDVLGELEVGRWLELVERGEVQELGGVTAPWLRVRDPWSPRGDGLFGGTWEGWVWGQLLSPLPPGSPAPTQALWDRVIVRLPDDEGESPRLWALRSHGEDPTVLELETWASASGPLAELRIEGWSSVDSVHRREPGGPLSWLWIVGRSADGSRQGVLLSPGSEEGPLRVDLDRSLAGGERLRGAFFLLDLDSDGVDEAVVQWTRHDSAGSTIEYHFAPFVLLPSGGWRPAASAQVRDALLPVPDLQVRSVRVIQQRGRAVAVVRIQNAGSRSTSTRLRLVATPSRSAGEGGEVLGRSSTVELELRELAAEEILQLEVPLELPRGRWSSCLLDAVAVPVEVEQALDNNRLAVQVSL